jgi:hypothetical protein
MRRVPNDAIIDRIKGTVGGLGNAKKTLDSVKEEKLKEDARKKQKQSSQTKSKPPPSKSSGKAAPKGRGFKREL